ncbi:DUF805 domain-containing protein [Leifsonia sp. SIMBA_070]|uniref:DUF805 domain-containing protein n=1 Tax=Leifsonia sp. SIMBA_070 TaxID=3085810 RepID=UPI00397D1C75
MTTIDNTLTAPLRGATIGQAFFRFWAKYGTFTGRASASEFWWAYLFVALPSVAFSGATLAVQPFTWLAGLWSVATIIPMLAVTWRRLHDTNRSGANWFWGFIPVVGWIILIVQLTGKPNPAGERFDV